MGKRRVGRPKLAKGKGLQAAIIVRLSPAERRSCERAAKAEGVKLSQWTRDALMWATVVDKMDKRRAEELNPDAGESVPRLVKGL